MQFHAPWLTNARPSADALFRSTQPQQTVATITDIRQRQRPSFPAFRNVSRVGVLDDDIVFIRFVERALRTVGVEVQPITTFDLGEAVRVISETACDAVFVDVFMYEGIHGFACVERLRAEASTRHLPIVVTTGAHDIVARRSQFLADHRCSVLLKPFSVEDLISIVQPAG